MKSTYRCNQLNFAELEHSITATTFCALIILCVRKQAVRPAMNSLRHEAVPFLTILFQGQRDIVLMREEGHYVFSTKRAVAEPVVERACATSSAPANYYCTCSVLSCHMPLHWKQHNTEYAPKRSARLLMRCQTWQSALVNICVPANPGLAILVHWFPCAYTSGHVRVYQHQW